MTMPQKNFPFGDASDFNDRSDVSDMLSYMAKGEDRLNKMGDGLPPYKDCMSEIYDENEKEAIFNSSKKKGGAMHDYNRSRSPD